MRLPMERLLKTKDVMEIYGLSEYQARILMIRAGRTNVGKNKLYPRWVTTASRVDSYLRFHTDGVERTTGLDASGKLLRR